MKVSFKLVCTGLCISLLLAGCGGNVASESETAEEKYVEILTASKSDISREYTYSGKVKPSKVLYIMPSMGGKVAKINFDVGDSVNENDILFEMDTLDIENNLDILNSSLALSEAGVKSAETAVEFALGSSVQSSIATAEAARTNAGLAYENAKKNYENSKVLFAENIISKDAFDGAQMAFNSAEASYNQALAGYDIAVNQLPKESLQRANDALESAIASRNSVLAQIKSAEKSLNDAKVITPINGVVSSVAITEGGTASPSSPAFTVINIETLTVNVSVSENIIGKVKSGGAITLKIPAYSSGILNGKIKTVSPAANQTGTYEVEIEIDNPGGKIKSDMFAEVYFVDEHSENAVVLPRSLVLSNGKDSYVFIVEEGTAKKAVVSTGIDTGDSIEITSGLQEGTFVVSKGQTYLDDGDKVSVSSSKRGE